VTGSVERLRRGSIPLLVGVLLGFIGGYFAAGGARPNAAATPAAASAAGADRIQEIEGALQKDPESPKLLTALGNAFYDREDWDGAVRAYEKARRKASGDPNLLSDLGAAYRNRGEFKHAIALLEKARAADPDHWQSLLNLVLINAFDTRDAGAARRHFAELKRRYPEVPNLDRIEKQIAGLPGGAS
jgi:cytochrome c-type biogenesis protein CcmH/NrfG